MANNTCTQTPASSGCRTRARSASASHSGHPRTRARRSQSLRSTRPRRVTPGSIADSARNPPCGQGLQDGRIYQPDYQLNHLLHQSQDGRPSWSATVGSISPILHKMHMIRICRKKQANKTANEQHVAFEKNTFAVYQCYWYLTRTNQHNCIIIISTQS